MVSFHELVEDDKGEVSTLKVTIFAVAAVHVVALVSRNGALRSPSSVRAARFVAFTSFTESACVIVRLGCLGPNREGPRTSFIASNVRSRRDDRAPSSHSTPAGLLGVHDADAEAGAGA